MTLCREHSLAEVPGWRREAGLWYCPAPGLCASLACPAGRPDARGGPYCDAHGGAARARAEAESEWDYLAPASVGNSEAVQAAGLLRLDTRHAYLVVREDDHGAWLAWTGVGTNLDAVPRPDYAGCGRRNCRRCQEGRFCGRGQHAFADRFTAIDAGTAVWRARLTARVREIAEARGGTLAWGVPVTPLADPILVELGPGENAWDVVERLPRIGSAGDAVMSGLRYTGEAP